MEVRQELKNNKNNLTDDEILNSAEFEAFNRSNPTTSTQENLDYYKKCKL
jgi:hypothetical protein